MCVYKGIRDTAKSFSAPFLLISVTFLNFVVEYWDVLTCRSEGRERYVEVGHTDGQ